MASKSSCIFVSLLLALLPPHGSCDYFTSVAGLDDLLTVEAFLVQFFQEYMLQVEARNLKIERFLMAVEKNIAKIEADPLNFYGNPITAYQALRKFVLDWKQMMSLVVNNQETEAYLKLVQDIENEINKPNVHDLTGAVKGILRLQDTYAVAAAELANGTLAAVKYSTDLTYDDCYHMGRIAYELQQYHYAVEWLIEARIRLEQQIVATDNLWELPPMAIYYYILEYLASAMSKLGNHKMADKYNTELLELDPANQYGLAYKDIYKRNLQLPRPDFIVEPIITKQKSETMLIYERLCREEQLRTPAEERKLHCRYESYESNNVPFCLIAPFRMEVLSHDPFVAYYHEAINELEIANILNIAEESVERSTVGDAVANDISDARTSKNAWLRFDQHSFLHDLEQRLVDITGLSLESAEQLQVVNYGIGGHYGPHHDFIEKEIETTFSGLGNRLLTALIYINDVELGGSTVFPHLRLTVPPIRRSMLVWYNLHESLEVDYRTIHAGCPVLKGSKWVCNEWFHEVGQEFNRPCSTLQMGHKSIAYQTKV